MATTRSSALSTSPKLTEEIYPIDSKTDPHPLVFTTPPDLRQLNMDVRRPASAPPLSGALDDPLHTVPCQSELAAGTERSAPPNQHQPEASAKPTDKVSAGAATYDTSESKQSDTVSLSAIGGELFGGGEIRLKNKRMDGSTQLYEPMPTISEGELREGSKSGAATPSTSATNSYSATYSTTRTSSVASNTSNISKVPNNHLTVEGDWKVEVFQKEKKEGEKSGVILLALVKWIITIVMMLALLVCLITVKLSVLVLSKQLDAATPSGQSETEWTNYMARFIVLYLLLSVPPLLNALRSAWYGLFDSTVPWPSRRAVLLAVVRAGLESLGLCLMCYKVLGQYDSPLSLLLLATPLFGPAMDSFRHTRRGSVQVVGVVFAGIGFAGTVGLMVTSESVNADMLHVVVAILALSLAWLPSLQRYITVAAVKTGQESFKRPVREVLVYNTFSDGTTTTSGISGSLTGPSQDEGKKEVMDKELNGGAEVLRPRATWKSAFIVHSCRVVFTFLISALILMLDSEGGPNAVFTDTVHTAFLNAWDLNTYVTSSTWTAFGLALGTGLVGYVLAFGACHMNMMRGALAPALVLATPLAVLVVSESQMCDVILGNEEACSWDTGEINVLLVVGATLCFLLAPLLTFGWSLIRSAPVLLQQESVVFWLPGYNSPGLDTWVLVNRRRDVMTPDTTDTTGKKSKVYICTTMYRENEEEMRQLLESIKEINKAQAAGSRCFESHIIFDGGVRQRELCEFSLTLIGLLDDTLGVQPEACTKIDTPYGLKLSWALPGPRGKVMPFTIHLKDNLRVKNKKRWSQVMYMSYVLDFLTEDHDQDSFILTTDADVVFTPDSVEALLDLMTRDHSIGAVCARTHPMGDGPLVWYQKFEYAIGHWFQKTAEHVLGSVLCAPGCFSVYRCRALRDILPKYARRVESAFDFLTKDMGEDRWLCTLMVQSGWRIEYCATSENRTNCPSHFDEFYKQRRRWIASTLANLMLIVKEWKYVRQLNHRVSNFFLLYQALLLCSTLIGPSTIVLVVSGGLSYAWQVDIIAAVVLQILLCIAFAMLCVYTTQETQLLWAKIYTFVYAVVMTAVSVGTAEQIVEDLGNSPEDTSVVPVPGENGSQTLITTLGPPNSDISIDLPISVTTLYFAGLAGIFVSAAILHIREFWNLAHALWYLLCLPSGYLVLTIYSVCNITDSSWGLREERVGNPAIVDSFLLAVQRLILHTKKSLAGTREQGEEKSSVKKEPWQRKIREILEELCFCCAKQPLSRPTNDKEAQTVETRNTRTTSVIVDDPSNSPQDDEVAVDMEGRQSSPRTDQAHDMEVADEVVPVSVEDWLPLEMRGRYAGLFKDHGFDNTLFIAGMTEKELRRMGVTSRGHMHYLLAQVALIPAFEIEYKVPTDVDQWLTEIGLPMYRDNFRRNHIRQPKEMEVLKSFGRREIEKELGITKDGHIKRLQYAIRMLRDPTEAQQKTMRMKQVIEDAPIHYLREINAGEYAFWEKLRECCLQPDLKAFGLENEVKGKLGGLRNDWLLILAVSNTLWLILITTLASNGALTVLGANPVGLVFLVVFGALFVIQFLTMLQHRLATFSHFLARAPYRCGRPMQTSWSFSQAEFEDTQDREEAQRVQQVKQDAARLWHRKVSTNRKRKSTTTGDTEVSEKTSLL